MKKYLLSFFALVLAIGMSAFSVTKPMQNKAVVSYHWYTPDGLSYLGFGEFPSTNCTMEGFDCAKGFINDPSNPQTATPQKRVKNN